ncbi:TetR/AcrR family transcriptional regulator [Spongisporangium articulatum]|uniref:TetR/AcrR family transcriptional regulator n=1 Tax=Spongisporangium articulatum TaxID=3362603 RepID=A0ABW8AM96_9ACTN
MVETPRRRAPGMSLEERREMIVRAALPLVAELGPGVTTQQIARAAGIGEATVFRAFEDKAALLRACMTEAMRPEYVHEALDAIELEQTLEERLLEAALTLTAHARRVGVVVQALMMSGLKVARDDPASQDKRLQLHRSREESLARTAARLVVLMEPDADRFRVPLPTAARAFAFLAMSQGRPGSLGDGEHDEAAEMAELIDLFLHGSLKSI